MSSKARTYIYLAMSPKPTRVRVITPSDSADVKYDLTFDEKGERCTCMGNTEHGHCKHVTRFRKLALALRHGGFTLADVPVSDFSFRLA